MARFRYDEADHYGAVKSNYFNLRDDGDTATIRILEEDISDIEGVSVHEIKVGDRTIDVECLRAYNEPVDKCPLCRANYSTKARIYLPVYDEGSKESKIWTRGKTFFPDLASMCSRYRPLVGTPIEVERRGKAGDKNTKYMMYPKAPDGAKITDFPEIKAEGLAFQVKSFEDLEYYLQNGVFLEDKQALQRPTNNAPSREIPVRRRTNYGSEEDSF